MEKTHTVLRNIKKELTQSHDIKNTLVRLYQVSSNPNMALTSGQRGALNYYSALPNTSEVDIIKVLDGILSNISSSILSPTLPVPNTISASSPNSFEPIVQKINNNYKWNVMYNEQETPLAIDPTLYSTPIIAQQKADEFIQQLNQGNEKEWLKFGIVSWANNMQRYPPQSCQTEIMNINNKLYLVVSFYTKFQDLSEHQEIQTVKCSHKILQVEDMVEPTWLVRGYLPHLNQSSKNMGVFYLVYALKGTNNHTIENISNLLQKIVCA